MSAPAQALTAETARDETRERSDEFPPGIPYIVGNEGAERFSFYGMRAILYVYLAALYVQFVPDSAARRRRGERGESQGDRRGASVHGRRLRVPDDRRDARRRLARQVPRSSSGCR